METLKFSPKNKRIFKIRSELSINFKRKNIVSDIKSAQEGSIAEWRKQKKESVNLQRVIEMI